MMKLFFLLLIMLTTVVAVMAEVERGGEGGGYWAIQLSPNSISTVPFRGRHISVWEHATISGRFYAMPIVKLLPVTARNYYNILLNKYEMVFDIVMWSENARKAVFDHLHKEGHAGPNGEDLRMEDVEMLPMEKIRLVWHGTDPIEQAGFRLQDKWTPNTHLPNVRTFRFICTTEAKCDTLEQVMQQYPETFYGLTLEYIINGHRSARRQVQIRGENIITGHLYTQLKNMEGVQRNSERFITSQDMKKVVSESTRNVVASVVSDSNYVDTGDEVSVSNLIEHELTREQVTSNQFQPHMWDSVFWNPTWARPDKLTSYLNKMLSKDETDESNFLLSEQDSSQNTFATDENEKDDETFGFVKSHVKEGGGGRTMKKVDKASLLKALADKHKQVEWTGEVFRVKPMRLFRLNLSSLTSTANVAVANVQVHRYETVHSIKVTHSPANDNSTASDQDAVWSTIQTLEETTEKLKATQLKQAEKSNKIATALKASIDDAAQAKNDLDHRWERARDHILAELNGMRASLQALHAKAEGQEAQLSRKLLADVATETANLDDKIETVKRSVVSSTSDLSGRLDGLRQEVGQLSDRARIQITEVKKELRESEGRTDAELTSVTRELTSSAGRTDALMGQLEAMKGSLSEEMLDVHCRHATPTIWSVSSVFDHRFPVQSVLHDATCDTNAASGNANYWIPTNRDPSRSFTVDLGCPTRLTQVLLRNSASIAWKDRGTKVYRLDSSTDGRSWKTLKQETLPWTRVCPFPLHRVNVNVRARYLRFTAVSYHGVGAALLYFGWK